MYKAGRRKCDKKMGRIEEGHKRVPGAQSRRGAEGRQVYGEGKGTPRGEKVVSRSGEAGEAGVCLGTPAPCRGEGRWGRQGLQNSLTFWPCIGS